MLGRARQQFLSRRESRVRSSSLAVPSVLGMVASLTCIAVMSVSGSAPVNAAIEGQGANKIVAHVIADSVLLGARQQLRELGLRVDAVEGRQPARLTGALNDLPDDGLPVVIHLGTNGRFSTQSCQDMQEIVDGKRDVVFVTVRAPRPWVRESNSTIRACVRDIRKSTAVLIPWHRIANGSSELLYGDGIHLTPRGAAVLVSEVSKGLGLCPGDSSVSANRRAAQVGKSCVGSDVRTRMSGF